MILAIDFDGTIVEHKYPKLGKEIPMAIQMLKQLQLDGHKLILWTVRDGKELDEALEFCSSRGLDFHAVNRSCPDEVYDSQKLSRKIVADLYVDDRNFGGLPPWEEIYSKISKQEA